MKKILLVVYFLWCINLFCKASNTQNASWIWAKGFTSSPSGGSTGRWLILHPNGNIYCLGTLTCSNGIGSVNTGNGSINTTGTTTAFVTVFDQAGNLINIESVSGINSNSGLGFDGRPTVDDSGYLYMAITLQGSAIVDTVNIGVVQNNGFLSKWNSEGRCLWAKVETQGNSTSGLLNPICYGGSIYTTGSYNGYNMLLGNCSLSNPANAIAPSFFGKMDMAGNCDWLKQAGGAGLRTAAFMYLGAVQNGSAYLCCRTDSCFFYDTIQHCTVANGIETYLLQCDTAGRVQWIRTFSADSFGVAGGGVTADTNGNSYMNGGAISTFYIGNDTISIPQPSKVVAFLTKHDKQGNLLWVETMPSSTAIVIWAIYTDAVGYSYLTGYYSGTATFGNTTITSQSANDLFVTRYDPNGKCMGVVTVPNAEGMDIAEDSAGNAYVTGQVLGNGVFGGISLAGDDFFVAKLSAINYPTGEQSILNDTTLQIYSNPNRGQFTITVPQSITQAASSLLSIYDNTGNEILHQTVDLSSSTLTINLGNVNRGVYNVQLAANGNTFTGRVVIQ